MDKGKEVCVEAGSDEEAEEMTEPEADVAGTTGVKRWVVDLDLPPEERWREVVAFHAADLLAVAQLIRSELANVPLLPILFCFNFYLF
jgi:hypothetical protein